MKALSIRQPWSYLICAGYKDIENRNWSTKFRGRIYVHASTSRADMTKVVLAGLMSQLTYDQGGKLLFVYRHLAFGALIGEVDITDCKFRFPDENDNLYSKWHARGQYGVVLANPVLYDKPIPCKGKLGFFEPDLPSSGEPPQDKLTCRVYDPELDTGYGDGGDVG